MTTTTIIFLCIAAFGAGFVDAIVGGGGLIQTPAGLILLPNFPVATVVGSLKIPAFSGTCFAAFQYLKKVKIKWKLILLMMLIAFMAAVLGSTLLSKMHNNFMKPILLIVLSLVAFYTYSKKNFGTQQNKNHSPSTELMYGLGISCIIGFYDGFIGPGAGSFFVFAFITIVGFDFLQASAHAKMINLATNLGSISFFVLKGVILWNVAIPMALCNAVGGFLGAKIAIKKGNQFIRIFFLIVVIGTLIRFAYDVLYVSR